MTHPAQNIEDRRLNMVSGHEGDTQWRDQLRSTIRNLQDLESVMVLDENEKKAVAALQEQGGLPLGITPHYLGLMDLEDPNDPLRLQVVPRLEENTTDANTMEDPLGEENREPVPFLIHRYPDRVLLLVTDRCASYCRFCTRKRIVGQGPTPDLAHLQEALHYVTRNTAIREVILSGGDALMLADSRLESLLHSIWSIKHVARIRIATRMLTFAPMRFTADVVKIISAQAPVFILSHFNHVNEISDVTRKAIARLVDNGIPIFNQTVLLRGVNDNIESLSHLFQELANIRVHPYYLHQCDLVTGSTHFRVPLEKALQLVEGLRGHLSGLCIPTFVVDVPGGKGKVPLFPDPIVERTQTHIRIKGFQGETAWYPLDSEPSGSSEL